MLRVEEVAEEGYVCGAIGLEGRVGGGGGWCVLGGTEGREEGGGREGDQGGAGG